MNQITWLASYPKSGNTWFRIFLNQLLHADDEELLDINELPLPSSIASSRSLFDHSIHLESGELLPEEIERLRPAAYALQAREYRGSWPLLRKCHDAYTWTSAGQPLLGDGRVCRAIYLVRNPLDVCVSFAHHSSISLDECIDQMADPGYTLARTRLAQNNQLPQRLLSWSGHVTSWLNAPIALHVMRYEDMLHQPLASFTQALRFCGLHQDETEIANALKAASFAKLQQQEREQPRFREAPLRSQQFFRKGIVGDWANHLSEDQYQRILQQHQAVMYRLGYLDAQGRLSL